MLKIVKRLIINIVRILKLFKMYAAVLDWFPQKKLDKTLSDTY